MYLPKTELYNLLSSLGYQVYQVRPEIISVFPCITFNVSKSEMFIDLDKEIGYQQMMFNIDIWANSSVESSEILQEVEELLRGNSYRLYDSYDVTDPDGYSHIASRFLFIN